ncbi:Ldh family oxidoreductase [Uruburuella testudinis]|uniref:Ldh family oxidoreductase n=1 Tax=Uruburuella testudinis TaxID=1282863 RepID=A0ABY4DWP2_9NEIS|nr:Ldh family oxidoreductase [Uruburuella testudinis]UOO82479.1 Ldh family oxidoreductase [Uruburuella testudinis]
MNDQVYLSFDALHHLVSAALSGGGLSARHADAVARVIVKAERDQCRSHGLYRIAGVLKTLQGGVAEAEAVPEISHSDDKPIIKVNARGGFSPLAFECGAPLLAEKAGRFGIAAMAINDCVHFSALWPEVEQLAEAGVAALAMCPSNAYVAPAGGIRKLLGTNPLAFAWPCTGGLPYVFDFATSVAARGEVELHRLDNTPLPQGWAIDAEGRPTTDPAAALDGALLTFGAHKGSAVATMIELLAGVLIGDLLSIESSALDNGRLLAPRHGELLIAFAPDAFGAASPAAHTQKLLAEFTAQGARLPSQRRYAARAQSLSRGIGISRENLAKLQQMSSGLMPTELH